MRYYFHAPNAPDDMGEELPTVAAARRHASSYACSLMAEDPNLHADGNDLEIRVTDANGLTLFTFISIFIKSASITEDRIGRD